ncbi:putative siderophore transport system permease protein YfhA [compost metagenome]
MKDIVQSLLGHTEGTNHLIIMQFRLPRIVASLHRHSLAASGALLQGVIRNPLASPDLLGVTGGASVAVVGFMMLFAGASITWVPFIAIAGRLAQPL